MPLNFSEPSKVIVPLTRIIIDGDKRLRQIVGFAAVDQMNVIGMYEGEGGFVTDIASAVDVRGPAGKMAVGNDTEVVEVEGPPGHDGKSAYELWQGAGHTGTMQDFLASMKGADASIGDIRLSVAQYLTDNPPAAGKDATDEMVAAAVDAWLEANPPKDGEDGTNGVDGKDGLNVTGAMVANAVEIYLFNNPPPAGKDGKDGLNGKDGTNGINGKSVEIQKTSTAIQWRLIGDTAWTTLVTLAELKGDRGDAGQTFLRQINVTDQALVAISLGVVDMRFPCAGAVPGERYMAFIRSFKLNNAATATSGRPAGYYIVAVDCMVADTINIAHMRPALALGAKYELFTDIVKVNAS